MSVSASPFASSFFVSLVFVLSFWLFGVRPSPGSCGSWPWSFSLVFGSSCRSFRVHHSLSASQYPPWSPPLVMVRSSGRLHSLSSLLLHPGTLAGKEREKGACYTLRCSARISAHVSPYSPAPVLLLPNPILLPSSFGQTGPHLELYTRAPWFVGRVARVFVPTSVPYRTPFVYFRSQGGAGSSPESVKHAESQLRHSPSPIRVILRPVSPSAVILAARLDHSSNRPRVERVSFLPSPACFLNSTSSTRAPGSTSTASRLSLFSVRGSRRYVRHHRSTVSNHIRTSHRQARSVLTCVPAPWSFGQFWPVPPAPRLYNARLFAPRLRV